MTAFGADAYRFNPVVHGIQRMACLLRRDQWRSALPCGWRSIQRASRCR